MKILVTGSNGFIAKNLVTRLSEKEEHEVILFDRTCRFDELKIKLAQADFVFHLAGVNRPKDESDFMEDNADLTDILVRTLKEIGVQTPLVLASSIQVEFDSGYGRSKLAAEELALCYMKDTGAPVYVYRLPNVFGKWCKPNYNSAVATFCYNLANDLPITINDRKAPLSLVYIDDVCDSFIRLLTERDTGGLKDVFPVHQSTVGQVADLIVKFKESRDNMITEEVGVGLTRALYSTYISYFDPGQFSYVVPGHTDQRGTFVEMLKTPKSGQFSFFTAHPGVTRGGHYHHSKTEKFLVIKGQACYRFKHIITSEFYELTTDSAEHSIVETVPGWTHDITNVGDDELIVMLWANEIFDRDDPDTIASIIENEKT